MSTEFLNVRKKILERSRKNSRTFGNKKSNVQKIKIERSIFQKRTFDFFEIPDRNFILCRKALSILRQHPRIP